MYGLTMIKDYLNEILDGSKTFDARSYPTNKRVTIALVDSRTMKVYGTIELVGCREISPQEYTSWHCTGRWSGCIMQVDPTKKYYAWDFRNPQKLVKPIKLTCEKHTWVELPKEIEVLRGILITELIDEEDALDGAKEGRDREELRDFYNIVRNIMNKI